MRKCLYCLKQNEWENDQCQFCQKPLRANFGGSALRPVNPMPVDRPSVAPHMVTPSYYQIGCPLCSRADKYWEKRSTLYDVEVCKKCIGDFANRRIAAYVIDSFVLTLGPMMAIQIGISILPEPIGLLFLVLMLLIMFLGMLFRDGFAGKSIGKTLLGLQVINQKTGTPCGILGSLLRNIIFYIPILPLLAAIKLAKGKHLGDDWAKTKVIWLQYAGKGPFAEIKPVNSIPLQSTAYSTRLGKV